VAVDAEHRGLVIGREPPPGPVVVAEPHPLSVMTEPRHVVVVGAGPAGLMAAEVAGAAGHRVTVIERMASAGRKLLMAGRGGLNLTHSEDLEPFLARYGTSRPIVEAAVRVFPPSALIAWAEGLGQPTFIGSSGRVFPRAMKASPLLRAWLARLERAGVALRTRHRLVALSPDRALTLEGRDGTRLELTGDAVVLALGGGSWPRLGSDGTWTDLLSAAGIDVAPLQPSNGGVAIAWSAQTAERFAGTPLKRIAVSCGTLTQRGEAIVTRTGLEGGAIYALSPALREALARAATATLKLDLRPDIEPHALAARLAGARKGDSRSNMLRKAAQLSPAAIAVLRDATGNDLPASAAALAALIKAVPLAVAALMDLEHAISSAGGIAGHEIDPHFMLRKLPGVFVAGEMLDWDAPTGGYLLQASLATGFAAGRGVADYLGGDYGARRYAK
jgi:uncharacterized flavoprotein (TIGR03862 family)